MSGRAKIPYASFKVTLHAIKPQFIPRQGFIGRISPRVKLLPNISAGSPCGCACLLLRTHAGPLLLLPPRSKRELYSRAVVRVARSRTRTHTQPRIYVSVGDKVAGISIYLRAKASLLLPVSPPCLPPLDRRPAAKKKVLRAADSAPIAAINRRSFSRERIVERATMSPATSPERAGGRRGRVEGTNEKQREKSTASVYVSDSSTVSY